ncbi:hypothetical protein QQX98_002041 [Neonectria punicea]|uniref:Uncharacterized protein n=1 Tax=Neonectria punicea TaxID=979145 RepID=A0ABR1HKR0_9HYPO
MPNNSNDAASEPILRWGAAAADTAWSQVLAEWSSEQGNVSTEQGLAFTQFVANHFNARDLIMCHNMGDGPCEVTMTCSDVNQPAGFLILNSFVAVHVLRKNFYDSLHNALNLMQNTISDFQGVFAPIKTESHMWMRDLLSVLNLMLGIGYAYSWNIPAKIFEGNNYHGVAKDSASAAITFGISLSRNHLPTTETIKDDVSTMMGAVFDSWVSSELEYLNELFSRSEEFQQTRSSLIQGGMALKLTEDIDLGAFVTTTEKIVYSQLIPLIWPQAQVHTKSSHPYVVFPMILLGEGDCITSGDQLLDAVSEDDAANIAVCYDSRTFYVGYPTWDDKVAGSDMPEDYYKPVVDNLKLNPLPGGVKTELDGTKWGGVTLEDLVISAYEGWRENDFNNSFPAPDLAASDSFLLMKNGLAQGALEELSPDFTDAVLPYTNYVLSDDEKQKWALYREPIVLEGLDD